MEADTANQGDGLNEETAPHGNLPAETENPVEKEQSTQEEGKESSDAESTDSESSDSEMEDEKTFNEEKEKSSDSESSDSDSSDSESEEKPMSDQEDENDAAVDDAKESVGDMPTKAGDPEPVADLDDQVKASPDENERSSAPSEAEDDGDNSKDVSDDADEKVSEDLPASQFPESSDTNADSGNASSSSSEEDSDQEESDPRSDSLMLEPHDEHEPDKSVESPIEATADEPAESSGNEQPIEKNDETPQRNDLDKEENKQDANDEKKQDTPNAESTHVPAASAPSTGTESNQPYPGDLVAIPNADNQLHGNGGQGTNSNPSSSEDEEDTGPLVIRQQPDASPQNNPRSFSHEPLARDQESGREDNNFAIPAQVPELDDKDESSDLDDTSIRARRAEDFGSQPPVLPPKLRSKSQTGPRNNDSLPPPIFNVGDKTASLGRGMWSDEDIIQPPSAHRQRSTIPRHTAPDRIIDFSQPQPKKSRGKSKRKKANQNSLHGVPTRIIDVPRHSKKNDVGKRPAMVSLHSGSTYQLSDDMSDSYDSGHEDIEDLNRLIREANSMELNPHVDRKAEPVDVIYPSYHKSLPRQKNLSSALPEVFAKLAVAQDNELPVRPAEETVLFSAVSLGPNLPPKSSRSLPWNGRPTVIGDHWGSDDNTSLEDADIRFSAPVEEAPKSLDVSQFMTEVNPHDYTGLDSQSEDDVIDNPYDARADANMPGSDMNPIVNADYQICTELDKNHHTFPRRMKTDKPKEGQSLNAIAIPLTDPSSGPKRRYASVPYEENAALKRNNSNPDIHRDVAPQSLFGQMPQIVVTRGSGNPQPARNLSAGEPEPEPKKTIESTAPQLHLSLGSDVDGSPTGNSNNLQINVLPSDDPNIINLNITTKAPPANAPTPFNGTMTAQEPLEVSPLQMQPVVPVTAVQHRLPSAESPDQSLTPQHRVVDMPSIMVNTEDPMPLPAEYRLPSREEPEAQQPPVALYPTAMLHQPPVQTVQPVMEPVVQPQQAVVVASPPPITASRTTEREQYPIASAPPSQNVVVEVPSPWGANERESDSSSDDSYDMNRTPSQRKLRSADELDQESLSGKYIEWYKSQYMKPTCCYYFLKHFVFVLNFLFTVVGLGLIGLGLWGIIDMLVNGLTDPLLILYDPILPVFVLGVVVTLICFYGAAGFVRDNVCMIKFFGSALIILCLIFVGGGICFWVMHETITSFATDSFVNLVGHHNYTTRKSTSFTIDQIQSNFGCCGFKGHEDWAKVSGYNCELGQSCPLPPTCCSTYTEMECTSNGDRYASGCMKQMTTWVRDNTPLLIGVWVGIILLFLINFVCIYFMLKEIRYLKLIRKKIFSIGDESDTSSVVTSDSEYDDRSRRGGHRRHKRRGKYHVNPAYN